LWTWQHLAIEREERAAVTAEAGQEEVVQSADESIQRTNSALRISVPFSERRVLLALGDMLVVSGAVLAALYLWASFGTPAFGIEFVQQHWPWFPVLTVVWWLVAYLGDLYDVPTAGQRLEVTRRIGGAGLGLLVIYLVAYFLSPRDALPRLFFLFFGGVSLAGLLAWRWLYATVFTLPPFRQRVLIAGAGWAGHTMAETLMEYSDGDYVVVGFVDDDPEKQGEAVAGWPVLGSSRELVDLARAKRADKVVAAVTHEMGGSLFQALMDCRAAGMDVIRMPELYEKLTRRVPVEHVERGWVVESMNNVQPLTRPSRWMKRLLDIALGIVGGVVLLALLPFIALAITLDCPGPIFYRQVRLGQGGQQFRVWKLRTMIPDAEEPGEAKWAERDDPRITKVGKVLRKTRLDELPQVISILRGEMSIVGPRPERPEFIEELQERIPFYRTRLTVKPGLTGWAQIHYGYGNSVEDGLIKLQYDLYYVRHWSLWLDLFIILKTVGVVLTLRGT
jgi:exopolysaccharide biosynthesis polyprenyl glycosylphosphotransferase